MLSLNKRNYATKKTLDKLDNFEKKVFYINELF